MWGRPGPECHDPRRPSFARVPMHSGCRPDVGVVVGAGVCSFVIDKVFEGDAALVESSTWG